MSTKLLHEAFRQFDGFVSTDDLVTMLSLIKCILTECPDKAVREVCDAVLGDLISDVEGLATKAQADRDADMAAAQVHQPQHLEMDAWYRNAGAM